MKPSAIVRQCAFCDATENLLPCDWLSAHFLPTTYRHIKVGDKVRRAIDRTGHPAAIVVEIEAIGSSGGVRRIVLKKHNQKQIERYVLPNSPVQVLTDAPCGALCCELHRVERGADPAAPCYCQEHWHAWREIA